MGELLLLSILVGIFIFFLWASIASINYHLNNKILCMKCNIVSRRGIVELYNINKEIKKCPHCEEATKLKESSDGCSYRYIDDLPTPFAPSISWIKRQKNSKNIDKS